MSFERVLVVPDVHRPFHDRRAWAVMLKAAKALFKPVPSNKRHIITLGDYLDFFRVSSHSKNPARATRLEEEIADGNAGLDELDALGADSRTFIEGNHCDRLARYIADKAPELHGVMPTVSEMLRLKRRGWKFVPYRKHFKLGRIYFTHDTGVAGAGAHAQARRDFEDNAVIGHVHRMAVTYSGNAKGVPHIGASFGWLGDIEAVDYMHQVKALRDWQLGFGVGYLQPNGVMHLQAVPIIDYTAVIDGKAVRE